MENSRLASYHQERIWFIDEFESGYLYDSSPVYHNIPLVFEITGDPDVSCLEESIRALIKKHRALHTDLFSDGTAIYQRANYKAAGSGSIIRRAFSENEKALESIIRKEVEQPFSLQDGPKIRALLIGLEDHKNMLVLTLHHAMADKYSLSILTKELFSNYKSVKNGEQVSVEPKEFQYDTFSDWQRETQEEMKDHFLSYWKGKLSGQIPHLELPTDNVRKAIHVYQSAGKEFNLPAGLSNKLVQYSKQTGVPVSTILLGTFKILLANYCRQQEIIVGISSENRDHQILKSVVGPIANLLPVRTEISEDRTFSSFVAELDEIVREAMKYPMSFDKLVQEINPAKDMSRTALFDVLFQYEEVVKADAVADDLEIQQKELNLGWGKYDLNLLVQKHEDDFTGVLVYNSLYYNDTTISSLIDHFQELLSNAISFPDQEVGKLDMLSVSEKNSLIQNPNSSAIDYPSDKTIQDLFGEATTVATAKTALVFNEETMSYKELNSRSNRLAHFLIEKNVRPGSIVALLMDKSFNMIVSILAVLKAGGTYLPIDPDYPEERKLFMLEDSKASLMLVSHGGNDTIKGNFECINMGARGLFDNYPEHNPEIELSSETPAYIIYTSGTSGKPKGVVVSHKNVLSLLCNKINHFDFSADDVWTMFHSYCFDFSVWEMYGALLNGGKLILISKDDARDVSRFIDILIQEKVSVLNQTPSAFRSLMNVELPRQEKQLELKYVIFGGEALMPGSLNKWHERYPGTKLINMYGITETTVHVTYKEITKKEIENGTSNIGVCLPTLTTYVLDGNMRLLPPGIAGQLYIGGEGVSKGYLGRDELTKEKFIQNPYKETERIYKSGDLVKRTHTGDLEFVGRIDDQVKVRGYRIELGEIETRLKKNELIEDAIVLCIEENSERMICAYYVSGRMIEPSELRNYLSEGLPEYMLPSFFVQVRSFPMTGNGKVDKKALPKPQANQTEKYISPQNSTEEKLQEIWSEILGLNKDIISVESSFFELGGHSLRATTLVSRIHKTFDVKVLLAEVFKNPTIQYLAGFIQDLSTEHYLSILPAEPKEYYSVSSAQKRLFILQQFELEGIGYNMPLIVGLGKDINQQKLEKAFNDLVARHESLRTSFEIIKGEAVQKIHREVIFKPEEYQAKASEVNGLFDRFIRPFDLAQAPLLRVGYVNVLDGEDQLMIDMHHIITDGVSHEILKKEFWSLYNGESLPALKLQYKDYSEWLNSAEQQKRIRSQEAYWLNTFEGDVPVLNLPVDHSRPALRSFEGSLVYFELTRDEYSLIQKICKENGVTTYMCLLSVLTIWLSKLSGQEDIVIGSPVAARRHTDLEPIIGMFVNTLAMRNYPCGEKTFKSFLEEVKLQTLKAYENQEYAFEDLVEKVLISRDTSRNPLFDVMFAFHNQTEKSAAGVEQGPGKAMVHFDGQTKFDIGIDATETTDTIVLRIEYCKKIFKASTIDHFIAYLHNIIKSLNSFDIKLSDMDMLTESDKRVLLYDFNNTDVFYGDKTVVALFEEQVEKNPGHIAVTTEGKQISYKELNECSNQLADYLKKKHGIQLQDIVGILQERSEWMIISILAVLKSGGAYVPMELSYPRERINHMKGECSCKIVIDEEELNKFKQEKDEYSKHNLEHAITANSLAYVMYTSGSTGYPKGVMIEHHSLSEYVQQFKKNFSITADDKIIQQSSLTFDTSVEEIFPCLLAGANLFVVKEGGKDVMKIKELIEDCGISLLSTTPLVINELNKMALKKNSLRWLVSGGEKLNSSYVTNLYGACKIANGYGPTEATVCCTYNMAGKIEDSAILGSPIDNRKIYILDKYQNLLPVGLVGELYVSGAGLARGYINNPQLTAEKFVANPFFEGERMYRTGDLGKWLPDGRLEYAGRMDDQVKIRGYRVELGEIEAQLREHQSISDAVVVVTGDGQAKKMCAFYLSDSVFKMFELRNYLLERLPEYMIPSSFVKLDSFPLTTSGKVNKKLLTVPEMENREKYTAPRNELELKLINIWAEVLEMEPDKIGIHNNFFDLGGNSIKLVKLVNTINNRQLIENRLADWFIYPTISEFIDNSEKNKKEKEEKEEAQKAVQEEEDFDDLNDKLKRLRRL